MDEQIVENNAFRRSRAILKESDPHEKGKVQKSPPQKTFSGPGSAFFFGFLVSSSSSWPDSRPISPNLGRFRAIIFFLGVIVPFSMSEKSTFPSTYGKVSRTTDL